MSRLVSRLAGVLRPLQDKLQALALIPAGPLDYPFAPTDVAQLQRLTATPGDAALDDQTWNDLLLERYSEQLSAGVSIFGRQVLHQRLRAGLCDGDAAALGERVRLLMQDPAGLDELRETMRSLREADTEVAALLFEGERAPAPPWLGRIWLLPLGLVASVAAVALSPLAWLAAGGALYLLISIQMRYAERVEAWSRAMKSLQMLLRVCSLLGARDHPLLQQFDAGRELAGRVNRSLSRSPMSTVLPGARGYADWFMLANVTHYFKTVDIVFAHRAFLRECYLRCANFEADAALARHLLDAPSWCWAERGSAADIDLEQGTHPLLEQPAPLSISLRGKGAFISGQNGAGKSTFLRMLGLNLVAARAFGVCYARRARMPASPVYASLQSKDSLLGGESLYVAELRRAKELLAAADRPQACIYLIDEIFRGTNHLESVSAAAGVLDALAAKGVVVVSSHNLVLAPLLEHWLDPYFVGSAGDGPLALLPGVLPHTNGIALLAAHGFGAQVQAQAGRVAEWLNQHLAHPIDGGQVLAAQRAPSLIARR
jgi:hypothetical protein